MIAFNLGLLSHVLSALDSPISAATRLDPYAREPKKEINQAQQDCSCALTTEQLRQRDAQFSRMLTRVWLS